MKGKKRHDFFYQFTRVVFQSPLIRRFNYKFDKIKVEDTPYVVVANHVTNFDPILVGLSFKKSMYYVASDHIMRLGFVSKLLNFAISPIARAKTATETQTVITIFKRLKEKFNVCIFAEGLTSFDGKTGKVQPSIGKLVKRAGVTLVTYRFTGSFFTFPRWARFSRKGKMEGRLVNIYSPEELASMTDDEVNQVITKDIYVNAYEDQEKNPVAYKGKKSAECLETILYCCPKCRQFGKLSSSNDILSCSCGFKVRFNEYCYFEIPDSKELPPFKTITQWVKWEREELNHLARKDIDENTPIFTDENQQLYETQRASHNTLILEGKLCLYKNRLVLGDKEFLLDDIIDISVITMKTIIFAVKSTVPQDKTSSVCVYEIHSAHPRSALKYMDMLIIYREIKKNIKE